MALGSLVAFGPMAKADESDSKPGARTKGKAGARHDRMGQIVGELNLTDDQKAKVKPIFQDEAQKMKTLRQDTNLSKQDKMTKLKTIREDTAAKVKPILTADQFEKWNKLREEGPRRHRKP
jgi:Spy/CpxP family protein refolding chaperone